MCAIKIRNGYEILIDYKCAHTLILDTRSIMKYMFSNRSMHTVNKAVK